VKKISRKTAHALSFHQERCRGPAAALACVGRSASRTDEVGAATRPEAEQPPSQGGPPWTVNERGGVTMPDLAFVALTVVLFGLTVLVVRAVERL
jgi:hypothetical protein